MDGPVVRRGESIHKSVWSMHGKCAACSIPRSAPGRQAVCIYLRGMCVSWLGVAPNNRCVRPGLRIIESTIANRRVIASGTNPWCVAVYSGEIDMAIAFNMQSPFPRFHFISTALCDLFCQWGKYCSLYTDDARSFGRCDASLRDATGGECNVGRIDCMRAAVELHAASDWLVEIAPARTFSRCCKSCLCDAARATCSAVGVAQYRTLDLLAHICSSSPLVHE
jgi:hypothetical protein